MTIAFDPVNGLDGHHRRIVEARMAAERREGPGQRLGRATVAALAAAGTPSHQAPIQPARVRRYAAAFDPALFGVVHVRVDAAGRWWLEDGQHRVAAGMLAGRGDLEVDVQFSYGMDERQAELFYLGINDRKTKPQGAILMARAQAGDPVAAGVFAAARRQGFDVKLTKSNAGLIRNTIRCPEKLMSLAETHGEAHLDDVLAVVRDAWDGDPTSTQKDIVAGISQFLLAYPDIRPSQLGAKLAAVQPKLLMAEIATARVTERSSRQFHAGYAPGRGVLEVWNKGRKSQRREDAFNAYDAARRQRTAAVHGRTGGA